MYKQHPSATQPYTCPTLALTKRLHQWKEPLWPTSQSIFCQENQLWGHRKGPSSCQSRLHTQEPREPVLETKTRQML